MLDLLSQQDLLKEIITKISQNGLEISENSLDILLITGAGGALGFIIRASGVIESLVIVNFNGIYGLVSVFNCSFN